MKSKVPKYNELIKPTFNALKNLGGSGSNKEILEEVIKILNLSDEIIDEPHPSKYGSNQTELEYRLAWARTYLSKSCVIESSARAVWSICPDYTDKELSNDEVVEIVRKGHVIQNKKTENIIEEIKKEKEFNEEESWKIKLAEILHNMNPFAFERLAQRILRESGFSKVEVTKKTGDGGIDGNGELKINNIFTMKVAFQCKRYKDVVDSQKIRDFRGSLTTDIEKAVLITTSTFTSEAIKEAAKPGKTHIDLMDGEELIERIVHLGLGVKEIKTYKIDENFFLSI